MAGHAEDDVDRAFADLLADLDGMSSLNRAVECQRLIARLKQIRPAVIAELRETHTQREVAELLGISQQMVSKTLITAGRRTRGKPKEGASAKPAATEKATNREIERLRRDLNRTRSPMPITGESWCPST